MTERFPISAGRFIRTLFMFMGVRPGSSFVEIRDDAVQIRLGWLFRADLPLASVTGAHHEKPVLMTIGAHGWRGRWLVNGTRGPLVAIDADPPSRGRVMGLPVRVRQVRVSTDAPDALIAAIAAAVGR